jgi:hypothetical protein
MIDRRHNNLAGPKTELLRQATGSIDVYSRSVSHSGSFTVRKLDASGFQRVTDRQNDSRPCRRLPPSQRSASGLFFILTANSTKRLIAETEDRSGGGASRPPFVLIAQFRHIS